MKTGLMAGGIALLATLGLSFAAFAGPALDSDGDGVYDVLDNCVNVPNAYPSDCDTDHDGYGNICDGDFNQDYFTDGTDFLIFNTDFTTTGMDGGTGTDMNCDTYTDGTDFLLFNQQFTTSGSPGPSGLYCAGTVPCDL
ncbi:MAG TPA: thrombospondin type 3 repeat-containing protein [Myxococcota bacterium]|nr:thrombospondin type 3 repeat-containing protein [Myxococcota bacterium]